MLRTVVCLLCSLFLLVDEGAFRTTEINSMNLHTSTVKNNQTSKIVVQSPKSLKLESLCSKLRVYFHHPVRGQLVIPRVCAGSIDFYGL